MKISKKMPEAKKELTRKMRARTGYTYGKMRARAGFNVLHHLKILNKFVKLLIFNNLNF